VLFCKSIVASMSLVVAGLQSKTLSAEVL